MTDPAAPSTDPAFAPEFLAPRIRHLLAARDPDAPLLTYQALAAALGLVPPGVIRITAAALEHTMSEDAAAGRPMIAALVVSRGGGLPQRGFFDLAVELGRFPPDPATHRRAWQAEAAAVRAQLHGI